MQMKLHVYIMNRIFEGWVCGFSPLHNFSSSEKITSCTSYVNVFHNFTANDYGMSHFSWFITVYIWNIFFNGGQVQKCCNERNTNGNLRFPVGQEEL